MQLDHISISAPQPLLEQVRDFYCQVFELVEGKRPDFGFPGYWLYDGDDPIVHLIATGERSVVDDPHLDHVAFRSDDLAGLEQRLAALDCPYDKLEGIQPNVTQLFFSDPAGIRLEANVRT